MSATDAARLYGIASKVADEEDQKLLRSVANRYYAEELRQYREGDPPLHIVCDACYLRAPAECVGDIPEGWKRLRHLCPSCVEKVKGKKR